MKPTYKKGSSTCFTGTTGPASVAMVLLVMFAAAGCATELDHSSVRISTASAVSSRACPRKLNSDCSSAESEVSYGPPQFPSATIYRNEEANLLNTAVWQTSNGSQSGLFTPVWVIF